MAILETALPYVIPAVISAAGLVASAVYARRRGLPSIEKEIDERTAELIATLRGQVDAGRADIAECKPKLEQALKEIERLQNDGYAKDRRINRLYELLEQAGIGPRGI